MDPFCYLSCGHLLGKGLSLGSLICDIFVFLSLSWCPGQVDT